MPVYNAEDYIDKSINSVLKQTLEHIELICVNDCSSDSSLKKLQKFRKKDKRVVIIDNKKNCGPGVARNMGIKKAKGKYICFLDSDDWFEKDACEILYKKAEEGVADVVFIKPKLVFADRTLLDKRLLTDDDVKDRDIIFRKTLLREIAWAPWSKFIRRSLLIKNKVVFPNIYVAEDMDFSYKAIYYSKKISYTGDYLYNYYLHENSLTTFGNPARRIENYFESIKLLKRFLKEKNIFDKYYKEFIYFKLYNYLAVYGVMYYSEDKIDKSKYMKLIKKDGDFSFSKIIGTYVFDSVMIGSILIKLHLFNPAFKIRELLRIVFGKWGRRGV